MLTYLCMLRLLGHFFVQAGRKLNVLRVQSLNAGALQVRAGLSHYKFKESYSDVSSLLFVDLAKKEPGALLVAMERAQLERLLKPMTGII